MIYVLRSRWVKCSAPHRCWGCLREFGKGSRMFASSIADDGNVSNSWICLDCMEAMEQVDEPEEVREGDFQGCWDVR